MLPWLFWHVSENTPDSASGKMVIRMEWEQRSFVGKRRFTSDKGLDIHLNYYLTEKKNFFQNGEILYGIRVEKITAGSGNRPDEAEQTPVLSASRHLVEKMIGRLMEGLVTPVSLLSVVDDLMGQDDGVQSGYKG